MYKITRKRVVRQVKQKATLYRGACVRENVTHNATITDMDRHENVLVLSNGETVVLLRALNLMLASQTIMGTAPDYDINYTRRLVKYIEEAFAINPIMPPEA